MHLVVGHLDLADDVSQTLGVGEVHAALTDLLAGQEFQHALCLPPAPRPPPIRRIPFSYLRLSVFISADASRRFHSVSTRTSAPKPWMTGRCLSPTTAVIVTRRPV